jgi:hypothetical protein
MKNLKTYSVLLPIHRVGFPKGLLQEFRSLVAQPTLDAPQISSKPSISNICPIHVHDTWILSGAK